MDKLNILFRHNERKNSAYSNKEIDREKSKSNYSLKKCFKPYTKMFNDMRRQYNLKGQIKKNSNVACEYIITSDKEFFDSIGEEETKRYFETAYKFVIGYKNLGEQYIVSAKVHMDESTPHMHLVFLPVVHNLDTKSGKLVDKISCSEFWRGKNSYKELQDKFYDYIASCVDSNFIYKVRFTFVMMLKHFINSDFIKKCNNIALNYYSEEYYINMAIAWYFSYALIMQYDNTIYIMEAMAWNF